MISGEPGTGKSVALRIVAGRLSTARDVTVGVIERPQSKSSDFYRELGDIFAVKLTPSNRWGGFKVLRERWKTHVTLSRIRPVLLIDEAQEMPSEVLAELRILASADFDATSLLTVVLSGDGRLLELLRSSSSFRWEVGSGCDWRPSPPRAMNYWICSATRSRRPAARRS